MREVIAKVPSHDANGMLYSSREVRVMRKRLRKGLDDWMVKEEERAELRKKRKVDDDDSDLLGLVYRKDDVGKKRKLIGLDEEDEEDEEKEEEEEEESEESEEREEKEEDNDDDEEEIERENEDNFDNNNSDNETASNSSTSSPTPVPPPTNDTPPSKSSSSRSKKPVPPGYVCSACKGKEGQHWIFDCRVYKERKEKERKEKEEAERGEEKEGGNNDKKKKKKKKKKNNSSTSSSSSSNPSPNKVFISGLPFDVKTSDVTSFFSPFGNITGIRLFCFDDSKRCKGEGIVEFETKEEAGEAIEKGFGKKIGGRWIKVERVKAKNETGGKKG
eukprot:CAMPEP_0118646532 /NCGR_PEP_ID=MMETSP0785-20121206/8111_1 /TAXON_ID=91992 /ORGANISM="Bolidomonas pacifica, Strain CCMP 1866" /LENGTH=330 /DNA_ID=CAMNT_0006538541 /DNA_START=99 /DNA_END=1087 /DNA_ORIENTATION=+